MKSLLAALILLPLQALAEIPTIEGVSAHKSGTTWRFDVTLLHPDSGWDHYADGWRIEDADGNELGYRKLFHPHENEQPFTRSLSGVEIPNGTTSVFIRAHGSVDGWGDALFELPLNQ